MKKLLLVMLAIICAFTTFAFGCDGGSNTIEVKGDEVMAGTLRRYISNRQETYFENDDKNATDWHWFDIDMQMTMSVDQRVNQRANVKTWVEYELDGKMGVYYPLTTYWDEKIKFLYDFKIKVKAENETYDSNGKKVTETIKMEGDIVFVNNFTYADLVVTLKSGGKETVQHEKVKGDMEDILDIDMDEFSEMLGSTDAYEGRLYGMSVSEILDSFASQVGVHYYLDEANNAFYIDYYEYQEDAMNVAQTTMKYEIEFKKNSAAIKQERAYVLLDAYTSGYQTGGFVENNTLMETLIKIKQIRSANITVPEDSGSYKNV